MGAEDVVSSYDPQFDFFDLGPTPDQAEEYVNRLWIKRLDAELAMMGLKYNSETERFEWLDVPDQGPI